MRGCRKWTLALVALCACSLPARAADDKPKPVPEEGALEVVLLRHKAVRDDLKLTHREARKIHEFTEQQWKKAQRRRGARGREGAGPPLRGDDPRGRAVPRGGPHGASRRSVSTRSRSRWPDCIWITRPGRRRRPETDRRTEEEGRRVPEAGPQGDGGAAPLGDAARPPGRAPQAARDLQGARARAPDRRAGDEVPRDDRPPVPRRAQLRRARPGSGRDRSSRSWSEHAVASQASSLGASSSHESDRSRSPPPRRR